MERLSEDKIIKSGRRTTSCRASELSFWQKDVPHTARMWHMRPRTRVPHPWTAWNQSLIKQGTRLTHPMNLEMRLPHPLWNSRCGSRVPCGMKDAAAASPVEWRMWQPRPLWNEGCGSHVPCGMKDVAAASPVEWRMRVLRPLCMDPGTT